MDGNVKDLGEARMRKAKKAERMSESELFYHLIMKMNRNPASSMPWPAFPQRFHLIRDAYGRKGIVEEVPDRIVAYRVDDAVTDAIAQYCHNYLTAVPGADISHRSAESCRRLWLSLTNPLDAAPLTLAEQSTPGLAFHRLNFDAVVSRGSLSGIVVPECPPSLDEFLKRCTQRDAVAAFIGSLFYPQADRQQYLYLHGEGLDGKGAFLRFLYLLFGHAVESLQPKAPGDRFWNMKIFGKRLVLFSDCEDYKFFSSPEFKGLTGNDPIYFEPKGESGFSALPNCKLIAASNFKPNISSQRAELRRLIFSSVEPILTGGVEANYELVLLKDAEAIVGYCKAIYERDVGPAHGPIKHEEATEVAQESEEFAISLFHQNFEKADDEITYIQGFEVLSVLQKAGIQYGPAISKLKGVWARRFGIVVKREADGIKYFGMTRHNGR